MAKKRHSEQSNSELSQWFDMLSTEEPEERKELQKEGLSESIAFIVEIIRREASIGPERIIVGGVGQGGATAIYALLYNSQKLSAFLGISSWIPFQTEFWDAHQRIHNTEKVTEKSSKNSVNAIGAVNEIRTIFKPVGDAYTPDLTQVSDEVMIPAVLQTPVFLSHSKDDEVVPISNGRKLWANLEHLGFTTSWNWYKNGGHWIFEPKGVDDMISFMKKRISFDP